MSTTLVGPAYRIETDRLIARCWSTDDAPDLRRAIDDNDDHLRPWIPFMSDEPRSLRETAEWLREQRADFDRDVAYRYGLFTRDERTLIGSICLFRRVGPRGREVGYWIHRDHGGLGYASEASKMMVRLAFETADPIDTEAVDRIEIHCDPRNKASWAVARNLGFTHETTLRRRHVDTEGSVGDTMIWTLFADDYSNSPSTSLSLRAFDVAGETLLDR
ncbi:MAG: GNAT family N-acetyltransferase [Thermoanaerobaculia bacterium]|nr:GNAT family N-acetyltransferase [Thermoanaerobaculia bacterium]